MNRALAVTTSFAASIVRVGTGLTVTVAGREPARRLDLYEYESCPFCRKVREALSILDLEATIYPCPKGGQRFRETVRTRGGKLQFPWLVDPNTGTAMYESDDIVRYLFTTYGDGNVPLALALGPVTLLSSALASAVRLGAGTYHRPAKVPEQPLELWSFEASPYCRLARETLCELELPYVLHNVAKGSRHRDAFVRRTGTMQVPYLLDPNTGTGMFESADIVAYLERTYG
ncbi:MAG: glutathione S-transferase N-terminal domain-containing protein [Candidatus Binatia bacterium]